MPAGNDPRTLSAWVNLDSVPEACESVIQHGSAGETNLLGMMVGKGGTSRETHLNFLLDKKEIQAKFVTIFLGVVGWVERDSVNSCQS